MVQFRIFWYVLALSLLPTAGAIAQMGGGMGDGDGHGSMHDDGIATAAAMGMAGGMGMGSGMMNDFSVGPDGTVYVLRRIGGSQYGGMMNQEDWKSELAAIDGRTGIEKWKVEIDAEMVSEPVFAKDGRLFVTASDVARVQAGGSLTVVRKARLVIIKPAAPGATVTTTDVESDVLSAPRIAPDESAIYATGFEMANLNDNDSIPAGQRDLYAFSLDGARMFKVTVGKAQFNLPPR